MDYCKVIRLEPRRAEAYINTAYSFQEQGTFDKAKDMFDAVLAMDCEQAAALEGRAIVNLQLGSPVEAIMDITRALAVDAHNAELYSNRGVIYQTMKDHVRAFKDFKVGCEVVSYVTAFIHASTLSFWSSFMLSYLFVILGCNRNRPAIYAGPFQCR